jgi:DNA-binding Lrp family transcriptional regulator
VLGIAKQNGRFLLNRSRLQNSKEKVGANGRTNLDELDVKIFRALISEGAIAPTTIQIGTSLREIARKLGCDDVTIRNRFRKLQEEGFMSVWRLTVNPSHFGLKAVDIVAEVEPESAKRDMIRKLRLVEGVVRIVNFYGKTLQLLLLYKTEESRSRAVELVSRITNSERVTLLPRILPKSQTRRLKETDMAIIGALAMDARKPLNEVAKNLRLSSRTVKNRLEKLRSEKTLLTFPELNIGDIPNIVPVSLSYSYARKEVKDSVDASILSHFDSNYLWGMFSGPEQAFIVLTAPSIASAQRFLDWAKKQVGIASAQINIPVECATFPEKIGELLKSIKPESPTIEEKVRFH